MERPSCRRLFEAESDDFDETVVHENQRQRFQARWGTPEYLDVLGAYWSSNYGWQTRIVETEPMPWNVQTQSFIGKPEIFGKVNPGSAVYKSQVLAEYHQCEAPKFSYFGINYLTNETGGWELRTLVFLSIRRHTNRETCSLLKRNLIRYLIYSRCK